MMDFETRVQELNKYVPILDGFIQKLEDDPAKASHIQSIRNVKCLITEQLLTESNISKCEAVLRKLDQMHKKEILDQQLNERIDALISRYLPFLENCIQKLEKCSPSPKNDDHLTTIRKLKKILEDRLLTQENIDICEISLQKLDEKVEKNTIDRIRARIESTDADDPIDENDVSLVKKAKIIPYDDNVLIDITAGDDRLNANVLAFTQDPRKKNKLYMDKKHSNAKTLLLEMIIPYVDDRLALRYNPKKKVYDHTSETENTIQPLENTMPVAQKRPSAFDNLSLTFMNATMSYSTVSTSSMNGSINTMPQMVPPPQPGNNVCANIVQKLYGELHSLQPQSAMPPTNFANQFYNANPYDQGRANMLQNLHPNLPSQHIPNAILPPLPDNAPYGKSDPRLNRNNRSQLYDPATVFEQPSQSSSERSDFDSNYHPHHSRNENPKDQIDRDRKDSRFDRNKSRSPNRHDRRNDRFNDDRSKNRNDRPSPHRDARNDRPSPQRDARNDRHKRSKTPEKEHWDDQRAPTISDTSSLTSERSSVSSMSKDFPRNGRNHDRNRDNNDRNRNHNDRNRNRNDRSRSKSKQTDRNFKDRRDSKQTSQKEEKRPSNESPEENWDNELAPIISDTSSLASERSSVSSMSNNLPRNDRDHDRNYKNRDHDRNHKNRDHDRNHKDRDHDRNHKDRDSRSSSQQSEREFKDKRNDRRDNSSRKEEKVPKSKESPEENWDDELTPLPLLRQNSDTSSVRSEKSDILNACPVKTPSIDSKSSNSSEKTARLVNYPSTDSKSSCSSKKSPPKHARPAKNSTTDSKSSVMSPPINARPIKNSSMDTKPTILTPPLNSRPAKSHSIDSRSPLINARPVKNPSTESKSSVLSPVNARPTKNLSTDSKPGSHSVASFKIPKVSDRLSNDGAIKKIKREKLDEFDRPKSSRQKDFAAELSKLDEPPPPKPSKKKETQQQPEVDKNSLLEQLSKVYGADKLDKIKSILEADNAKKSSDNESQQHKKKKKKRIRALSSEDEAEPEPIKKKPKTIKTEPPELDYQPETSPIKNEPKKKSRSSSSVHRESSYLPVMKKIKKESDAPKLVVKDKPKELPPIKEKPKAAVKEPQPSPTKHRKKKNELDRLNEDIDQMFIRDAVLHATGRRAPKPQETSEETFFGITVKKCYVVLRRCDAVKSPPKVVKAKSRAKKVIKKVQQILNDDDVDDDDDDNDSNLTIDERVQNTDPDYHFQSDKSNKCLICQATDDDIVNHYMKKHSSKEVFISRFNPDIAQGVKDNPIAGNTELLKSKTFNRGSKIRLPCGFCLQELYLDRRGWKLHFMRHTGEFHCKSCKVTDAYPTNSKSYNLKYPHKSSCKDKKKFSIDEIQFSSLGLDAFMCPDCNFVQLAEENMKQHIKLQHGKTSSMPAIRFLIIGFNFEPEEKEDSPVVSESEEVGTVEEQSTDTEHETDAIVLNAEHCYASPMAATNKLPPQEPPIPIPQPMILKQEPNPSFIETNRNAFSVSLNSMNQLKVWSTKPSFKSEEAQKKMLQPDCLYAFYKCMNPTCSFSTSTKPSMEMHLKTHPQLAIECSYCDDITNGIPAYFEHMETNHQSCLYQCNYCFYRSCAAYNVTTHENHYHRDKDKRILICAGKHIVLQDQLDHIYENRSKYVPQLVCSCCSYRTYLQDEFDKHLRTHRLPGIKCQSCSSVIQQELMLKHLLTHRIGLYECVYCFYGTMSIESIRLHMSTIHPTKLLYVTARLKRGAKDITMDHTKLESTVLAHIGDNVDPRQIIRQEFALKKPTSHTITITQQQQPENLPKISSILSFGESRQKAPNTITVINPSEKPSVISPNTKVILQGTSTTNTPRTKIIFKTISKISAPLKVISMSDKKFVRLDGMQLKPFVPTSNVNISDNVIETPELSPPSSGFEHDFDMSSVKEEVNLGAMLMDDDELM